MPFFTPDGICTSIVRFTRICPEPRQLWHFSSRICPCPRPPQIAHGSVCNSLISWFNPFSASSGRILICIRRSAPFKDRIVSPRPENEQLYPLLVKYLFLFLHEILVFCA